MHVLMDLEWYEQKGKPLMLTQIAALTVDENWAAEDLFYCRIQPQYQDISDWSHMAFSGGAPTDFEGASTLYSVLNQLSAWLRVGDVLCWWNVDAKKRFDSYLRCFGIQLPTRQHRILQEHVVSITKRLGLSMTNPYRIAKALGLPLSAQEHYSSDDVEVIRKVLERLDSPQFSLEQAEKSKIRPLYTMPYQLDTQHGILHRRGCEYVPPDVQLIDHQTLNDYVYGLAKVCPHCIGPEARKERIARNKRIIQGSHYTFVYTQKSTVFHRADCPHILGAVDIMGFGRYDKAVKSGLRPCKHCHPNINDQIPKQPKSTTHNSLPKKELQALARFNRSQMERKNAKLDGMGEQERRDFLALTDPGYGFWAASGYGTFHSRGCHKLKGLSNIRGFAKFDAAMRAGFTPCKCCKPTRKQDVVYSIPLSNQTRQEESPADLAALCERVGYPYSQEADIFELLTPVGRWQIHLKSMPIKVDHINLTMTPDHPHLFHRQHRMFLSLRDTFDYIKRHDNDLQRHGRRALGSG